MHQPVVKNWADSLCSSTKQYILTPLVCESFVDMINEDEVLL